MSGPENSQSSISREIQRYYDHGLEIHRDDPQFKSIMERDLTDGQHRNPTDKPQYFTTAFFHHPKELEVEVEESGFQLENIIPIEGVGALLQDLPELWNDLDRRKQLLETLRWLEDEPSILGVSGHLLAVARKL